MAEYHYDLVISGAGPAGTTCAMALEDSGLKIALLDRDNFPRDKICGDFVAAKGVRELVRIKPALKDHFERLTQKVVNTSTELYVGKMDPIRVNWTLKSYTIKREIFDHELLKFATEGKTLDFFPGTGVKNIIRERERLKVETVGGDIFYCRMIVGADGAHSQVAKQLAGYKVDRNCYGGSVRAYYKGVQNIDPAINEIYVHRDVLPGYFWVFPTSPTEANVGVGMHSRHITRDKVNLKDVFYHFIEKSPVLQAKLKNARMDGKLEGFGLPFYSKKFTVSGDRFILCGDAASMIDPTNGEGIMPAIFSGGMAAEHICRCFRQNAFDADFNRDYARALHGKYWSEMRMKSWLVRMFADKNRLLNTIGYVCAKSPVIKKKLQQFM